MRNDLTDLTVVLDRSGSMASCKTDAEGGVNEFIKKQKEQPGECLFTLVQFDDRYEKVYDARPIGDITISYVMQPRGMTALLDTLGRAITEAGVRLAAMPEASRPGLVIFVVITDGQENSSKEFTKAKIKEMLDVQQKVYNWQFTYLGANQDAFAEAGAIGFDAGTVCDYAEEKTSGGILAAGANVTRMRAASFAGAPVTNFYTDAEKTGMVK